MKLNQENKYRLTAQWALQFIVLLFFVPILWRTIKEYMLRHSPKNIK